LSAPGQAFMDYVALWQVVCPEQLRETRGFRLPLRGVIRLWIGIGSLLNLDGPWRRNPTGRGRRTVRFEGALIQRSGATTPRASTSAFTLDNSISFSLRIS
jgi:hypothetical protein